MKIAHIADTHLGYRAYHKTAGKGVNLREVDVAKAFKETIDRTLEIAPDAVLFAGDMFHQVRPPNATVVFAFGQIGRLSRAEIPTVIIGGNHDSPRSIETGNILKLFRSLDRVWSIYNEPEWVEPVIGLRIFCVAHNGLLMRPKLDFGPGDSKGHNVLLIHAAHESYKAFAARAGANVHVIHSDDIDPAVWDYIALGDYHTYQAIQPNMIYPGATERTSNNIWAEADKPKGFVVYDLDDGTHEFIELTSPRPVVDLGPYDGHGMTAAELDTFIECEVEQSIGGIGDKIVRLQILNVPAVVQRELNRKRISKYKSEATHFHLDIRRPTEILEREATEPGERRSLEQEFDSFIKSKDFDPDYAEKLIKLGRKYLGEISEEEWRAE